MRESGLRLTFYGVVLTAFGGVVGSWWQSSHQNRELDIRLVEIGLSILRAPNTEDQIAPARKWAIALVERNSQVEFEEEDRRRLLREPINFSILQGYLSKTSPSSNEANDIAEEVLRGLEAARVYDRFGSQAPRAQPGNAQ